MPVEFLSSFCLYAPTAQHSLEKSICNSNWNLNNLEWALRKRKIAVI